MRLYLLGVAVIAFLTTCGVALWYRAEAISADAAAAKAKADLTTAVAVSKAKDETIGRLRATVEANDRIVATVADQLSAINQAVNETNQQIGALKDGNEEVRAYLAGHVPPDLERLLNK